jgi:hypothetical protein
MKPFIAALSLLLCSATAAPLYAQGKDGVPLMKPALPAPAAAAAAATTAPGAVRTINWDALVPPNWDPFKEFKDLNFQALDDGDPRAAQMLKKMRDVWDNAPINTAVVGQTVRLPGFVVQRRPNRISTGTVLWRLHPQPAAPGQPDRACAAQSGCQGLAFDGRGMDHRCAHHRAHRFVYGCCGLPH